MVRIQDASQWLLAFAKLHVDRSGRKKRRIVSFFITRSGLPWPHPQGWFACLRQQGCVMNKLSDQGPIAPWSMPVAFQQRSATTSLVIFILSQVMPFSLL